MTRRPTTTTTTKRATTRPTQSIDSSRRQKPTTTTTPTPTTTTPTTTVGTTTTTVASVTESVVPPIFQLDPTGDEDVVPIIISEPIGAAVPVSAAEAAATSFGKAEVEVVDPTVYEDLLRKQTTAMPPLVTLLPVRSNSGIRTFRTPMVRRSGNGGGGGYSGEIETKRAFAKLPAVPPPATIVRASMSVGA